MVVNERGQIIGDNGILWLNDSKGYWSCDPSGYRIEPARDDPIKWELFLSSFSCRKAHTYIFKSFTATDCMRVAEIYQVRRT